MTCKTRTFTPEHRAKISASKKGKSHPHSDETKEKMKQAHLGRKFSEETKEKMRRAKLGVPKSPEHRASMRVVHQKKREERMALLEELEKQESETK